MALRVTSEGSTSLQAYRASLAAGGLAQPDVVISFTGLENKVEGVKGLGDFDPIDAVLGMEVQAGPTAIEDDKSRFPDSMPRPFEWHWRSLDIVKHPDRIPETHRNKAFRFNATGEFDKVNAFPFHNGDHMFILRPSSTEAALLQPHLYDLNAHVLMQYHVLELENSLAFAKVIPLSDRLIVHNIQSPLFSIGLPARLRTRFNYWQRHLMLAIEDFAFKAGFSEVNITTAYYQMQRWSGMEGGKGIHPVTAYQVYALEPHKMGYALAETPAINVEWIDVNLLWSKPRAELFNVPGKAEGQHN